MKLGIIYRFLCVCVVSDRLSVLGEEAFPCGVREIF